MPRSTTDNQEPPPRADNESSSRDRIIDLSPPKEDSANHPDAEEETSDVMEAKPWDPHKSAKNVEVGDYYAKQKNYKAAISRYREALQYKPKDAIATFRLAQALESNGETSEAERQYEEYLKILPNGPYASQARKALERMTGVQKRG